MSYVEPHLKRNRGWPWPEDSWGIAAMYGDDGWCRSCGVPSRTQCGDLVLQRRGFGVVEGAWIPNWQFDAICMADDLAAELSEAFGVMLRPVRWHGSAPGDAKQVVATTFGTQWFDPAELGVAAAARHGSAGARCQDCGVWRWLPLTLRDAPPLRVDLAAAPGPVIVSPEWFGDGCSAFRLLLVRRDLAKRLADHSPRDFAQP